MKNDQQTGYHLSMQNSQNKPFKGIICGDKRVTYSEMEDRARSLANALFTKGLKPGDCVAIHLPNCLPFVEVIHACQQAGFWFTCLHKNLKPSELSYILEDAGAKAIITHQALGEMAFSKTLQKNLLAQIAIGEKNGFLDYEKLLEESPKNPIKPSKEGGRMYYTSGTTGRPKGIRKKTNPQDDEKIRQKRWPAVYKKDHSVNLAAGPLYHAAPLKFDLFLPLKHRATMVIMEKFDPLTFLKLVEEHKVTHCHMVATMFQRLLSLPEKTRVSYNISSLEQILHGAAPTPVPVKKAMIDWVGPILFEYYGGSEGGGSDITSLEWLKKPGSVGRPWHKRKIVILDKNGQKQPAFKVGAVYFDALGEKTFEYYNAPEKTQKAYHGHLFTLGDYGYLDQDGYLFLTGRSAEVIIAGGVNIYPAEIDKVLDTMEGITDAAAIGVPNKEYGEEVKVIAVAAKEMAPSSQLEKSILDYCRKHLASYKCPRSVEFVTSLPRNEAGKLLRRELRKPYWQKEQQTHHP